MSFDTENLEQQTSKLATAFALADPFPHVVVDGLLNLDPSAIDTFPDVEWDRWNPLGDRYQKNKRARSDIASIPEPFKGLIRQLSEPRFVKVLEEITGIAKLIPDPYLTGGGLHLSGPGGILSPHTDFHLYRRLDVYRRINVLIYLNEGWTQADGGCLSLFDRHDQPIRTVVPARGRMVVFATDDNSVHGFPVGWQTGSGVARWRSTTIPLHQPKISLVMRRPTGVSMASNEALFVEQGFALYRILLRASRMLSIAAHLANPNQGVGLLKTVLANKKRERSQS